MSDIEALTSFYERAVGLRTLAREFGLARLGADEDAPLVELVAAPGAPARPPVSTGLFHLAILVPERADLARALVRLSAAGWRSPAIRPPRERGALPERRGGQRHRDLP